MVNQTITKTPAYAIQYVTNSLPVADGVYACRVGTDLLIEDVFLVWMDDRWWHLASALQCKEEVLGWIGPLARRVA
jgi:hypothetical protein